MTTITQTLASKAFVAFVAVAMMFSAFAVPAQAQTAEDLQAQIAQLLEQINTLQAQLGQGGESAASGVCPYTWTRDLSMGSTGDDVMKLQQFLNADADTRVAAQGAGSVGAETMYYGALTAAAVSKMQMKYMSEILTPNGLMSGTGYFGPSSRAKANAVCATPAVTVPDTDEDDDATDEDEDDTSAPVVLGGAAVLDTVEVNDPADSTISEGDRDVEIGTITVNFNDGDAEIDRLVVGLDRTNAGGEQDPWDTFENISLWVDGEMIAEKRANRRSDYLSENQGTLRFTNLGLVAMEDEELEIVVGAEVRNAIRDISSGDAWALTAESMRYFDADGVASNEEGVGDLGGNATANFTIERAGEGEEIRVSLSSSNPEATDIVVDESSNTNDVTIMEFDLRADEGDIEVRQLVVLVETPGETTANVVRDIELVIDGQTFRDEAVRALEGGESAGDSLDFGRSEVVSGNAGIWYLFDIDGDVVINEDDTERVEVVVDFKSQTGNYSNGQTVRASIGTTEKGYWIAEGADDLTAPGDFKGSAVGKTHTLIAQGLVADRDSFSDSFQSQGQDGTIGIFTVEFDVTAVEEDFYVAELAGTSTVVDNTTGGLEFGIEGPGSAVVTSATLASSANEDTSGVFTVRAGTTETFTLTVTVDASASGQHRVQLNSLFFSDDSTDGIGTTADEYEFTPASDFRSSYRNINQL